MQYDFVCIEGNIGIGKTTLVKRLAKHFNATEVYEEFDENPWLPLFYKNPEETALALELSFLTDRSKQLLKLEKGKKLISDYSIDKCLLFTEVNLSKTDYSQYKKLHTLVSKTLHSPQLVIVIHSTTQNLLKNIKKRNRSYEQKIEAKYLDKLNNAYNHFFTEEKSYDILNIFTEDLSEVNYERIFDAIVHFLKQKPVAKNTTLKL